jgi:hypothetical protein
MEFGVHGKHGVTEILQRCGQEENMMIKNDNNHDDKQFASGQDIDETFCDSRHDI